MRRILNVMKPTAAELKQIRLGYKAALLERLAAGGLPKSGSVQISSRLLFQPAIRTIYAKIYFDAPVSDTLVNGVVLSLFPESRPTTFPLRGTQFCYFLGEL